MRRTTGESYAHLPQAVDPVVLADTLKAFKKLQNGSDIRGVAVDGVQGQPINLTPATAYFIGKAFAIWLKERVCALQPTCAIPWIAIGRDPRISGQMLETAVAAGIASAGAPLCRTPRLLYFAYMLHARGGKVAAT